MHKNGDNIIWKTERYIGSYGIVEDITFDEFDTFQMRKTYDKYCNISTETHTNNTYNPSNVSYSYDSVDRLESEIIMLYGANVTNTLDYKNGFTEELDGITTNLYHDRVNMTISPTFEKDTLGRVKVEHITRNGVAVLKKVYDYMDSGTNCSQLVKKISYYVGTSSSPVDTLTYKYDNMGRTTEIVDSSN